MRSSNSGGGILCWLQNTPCSVGFWQNISPLGQALDHKIKSRNGISVMKSSLAYWYIIVICLQTEDNSSDTEPRRLQICSQFHPFVKTQFVAGLLSLFGSLWFCGFDALAHFIFQCTMAAVELVDYFLVARFIRNVKYSISLFYTFSGSLIVIQCQDHDRWIINDQEPCKLFSFHGTCGEDLVRSRPDSRTLSGKGIYALH